MKPSAIKTRALIDLLSSPQVIIPFAIGITSLGASWAVDGSALFTMIGIAGLLGAFGMYATSMLFWKEDILKAAEEKLTKEAKNVLNEELDALDGKLRRTREPRDQSILRELRSIYDVFKEGDVESPVNRIVDEMFHACIHQLESSFDVWCRQRKMSLGDQKQLLVQRREEMLKEVEVTVGQIRIAVDDLQKLDLDNSTTSLSGLNSRLAQQLKVAKEVEARMKGYDPDFEELEREISN